jgi:GH25 family lysozyme M1 (1,4-beta-N-acetylmuramidase)
VISGIDVSSYQRGVRWAEVRAAGAEFAIVKITEGSTLTNCLAAEQIRGALAAGLHVSVYHFAHPGGPDWVAAANAETKRVLQALDVHEQRHARRFFVWLDVEQNYPLALGQRPLWRVWCQAFRERMRASGREIGWYSYQPFTAQLELDETWSTAPLWLARYPSEFRRDCSYDHWPSAPYTCPKPWWRADVWQHGGNANGATWPGVDGPCDVDAFAGSREEYEELLACASECA